METQTTENAAQKADAAEDADATAGTTKEIITGNLEKNGELRAGRHKRFLLAKPRPCDVTNKGVEIGFLNADKITLKRDLETGETKEIVAESNVEIRESGYFCYL